MILSFSLWQHRMLYVPKTILQRLEKGTRKLNIFASPLTRPGIRGVASAHGIQAGNQSYVLPLQERRRE